MTDEREIMIQEVEGPSIPQLPDTDGLALQDATDLADKIDRQIAEAESEERRKNKKKKNEEEEDEEEGGKTKKQKTQNEGDPQDISNNDEYKTSDPDRIRKEIYDILTDYPEFRDEIEKAKEYKDISKMSKEKLFALVNNLREKVKNRIAKKFGNAMINKGTQLIAKFSEGQVEEFTLKDKMLNDSDFLQGFYYGTGRVIGWLPYWVRIMLLGAANISDVWGKKQESLVIRPQVQQ